MLMIKFFVDKSKKKPKVAKKVPEVEVKKK